VANNALQTFHLLADRRLGSVNDGCGLAEASIFHDGQKCAEKSELQVSDCGLRQHIGHLEN